MTALAESVAPAAPVREAVATAEARAAMMPLPPGAAAVLENIRTRRSLAAFLPEEPAPALVDALFEAANAAPNHHLTQPWRFFVLRGAARVRFADALCEDVFARRIDATEMWRVEYQRNMRASLGAAPLVIAAAAAPPELPHLEAWEELAATAAAVQNLLLAAHALGLAAFWKSKGSVLDRTKAFLGLAQGAQLVGHILLGHPRPGVTPAPRVRRPHSNFITVLE